MGKNEKMIFVPLERYEELIDLETRVNVAVYMVSNEEKMQLDDVLMILGTKLALEKANKIKKEKQEMIKNLIDFTEGEGFDEPTGED